MDEQGKGVQTAGAQKDAQKHETRLLGGDTQEADTPPDGIFDKQLEDKQLVNAEPGTPPRGTRLLGADDEEADTSHNRTREEDKQLAIAEPGTPPRGTRLLGADDEEADTPHNRTREKDKQEEDKQEEDTHPQDDTPQQGTHVLGTVAQGADTPQNRTQDLDDQQKVKLQSANVQDVAPQNRPQTLDSEQENVHCVNVEEVQHGEPLLDKQVPDDRLQVKTQDLHDQQEDTHLADSEEDPLQNGDTLDDSSGTSSGRVDGGWAWVVCFTATWVYGNLGAILKTSAIIYVAILEEYSSGDPDISFKTSWVMSLESGLMLLMSVVTGILCDRFGFRKVTFCGSLLTFVGILSSAFVTNLYLLYLTYGILLGVGFGLLISPTLVILGHYFKRRLGLANGIVMFGSASLTMTYALVLPRLLDLLGLTLTLVCLSGAVFLFMPCTLAWRPVSPAGQGRAPKASPGETIEPGRCACCGSGAGRLLNTRIWRNKGYIMWIVAIFVGFYGQMIPLVHVVKHSEDVFPDSDGSLLPLCIGAGSIVSRIIVGVLIDRTRLNRVYLQGASLLIMGISTFCLPLAVTFTSLVIACVALGMGEGALFSLLGPVVFQLVGPDDASQGLGCLFGLLCVPDMVGPPVAGLLYDRLGSYTVAFYTAGVPLLIGALVLFLVFPRYSKGQRATH